MLRLESLETAYFTVFYEQPYQYHAFETIRALESQRISIEKLTGNRIFHVPIVIDNLGTMSNGSTDPTYFNIHLMTYPPSFFLTDISFTPNWMFYVSVHEYTHMLHITNVSGIAGFFQSILGNIFYVNFIVPYWVIEGITVYSESQFSPFQGRLNDGYFDSYIAARVKDKRFPSILQAAYSPLEFPNGTGPYLYGGEFFKYLSETYGEDKFPVFFTKYGRCLPPFAINSITKNTYGKRFDELWKDWQKSEEEKYEDFRMPGEKLTSHGWYLYSPKIADDNLFYIRLYPEKTGAFKNRYYSQIIRRNTLTGKENIFVETTSMFSTPIKIHNNELYYSVYETRPGYANVDNHSYGYYSVVHRKNISTCCDKILFSDEIRDFDINAEGDILYSKDINNSFGSKLYIYDSGEQKKELFMESEYLIDSICINNEKTIVSARKNWKISIFILLIYRQRNSYL